MKNLAVKTKVTWHSESDSNENWVLGNLDTLPASTRGSQWVQLKYALIVGLISEKKWIQRLRKLVPKILSTINQRFRELLKDIIM